MAPYGNEEAPTMPVTLAVALGGGLGAAARVRA